MTSIVVLKRFDCTCCNTVSTFSVHVHGIQLQISFDIIGETVIWATSRENLSSGFATRVDSNWPAQPQRLEISDIETRGIILSRQWTTKVLIRLRRCAVWPASLLFAYCINMFSHDVAHIYPIIEQLSYELRWIHHSKKMKDLSTSNSVKDPVIKTP